MSQIFKGMFGARWPAWAAMVLYGAALAATNAELFVFRPEVDGNSLGAPEFEQHIFILRLLEFAKHATLVLLVIAVSYSLSDNQGNQHEKISRRLLFAGLAGLVWSIAGYFIDKGLSDLTVSIAVELLIQPAYLELYLIGTKAPYLLVDLLIFLTIHKAFEHGKFCTPIAAARVIWRRLFLFSVIFIFYFFLNAFLASIRSSLFSLVERIEIELSTHLQLIAMTALVFAVLKLFFVGAAVSLSNDNPNQPQPLAE